MPCRPWLFFALSLAACGSSPPADATPTPAATTETSALPGALPGALTLGGWQDYATPEAKEWATADLDDLRWAVVSAELACVDRAHQGDPDAQTAGSRRVLAHHRTTAAAVMDYGIDINGDATRATTLGELVAAAAERCS
jgi:hypothetical protein